jgi:tRNA(Ile)-lysidine synthase
MKLFNADILKHELQNIEGFSFKAKTIICVSGGVDSMALLHAASKVLKGIIAVTVDHKLRKASTAEAKFVAKFCQKLGVEHHTLTNKNPIPKSNIEENLRDVRYSLITEFARASRVKQALLAHHLNDNVETFFMRLERGSGLKGLSCMNSEIELNKVKFFRPLLGLPKSSLQAYLKQHKIKNIEDDSNHDTKFTRNKLRKFLESMNNAETFAERVGQTIHSLREAEKIIDDIEQQLTSKLVKQTATKIEIKHDEFYAENVQITLRILKDQLMKLGTNNKIPRFENLRLLYDNMAKRTFKKQTLNGCIISVKNNKIIIEKELKALKTHINSPY